MGDVLCAVRGGPGSYATRVAALEAGGADGTVHFLSVVAPGIYDPLHAGEQHAIRTELAWRDLVIGKAIASRLGDDEAQFTVEVRVGDLAETIAEYARELGVERILLGRPRAAPDAVLAESEEEFVAGLEEASGVPVEVVPAPEE
jgi:hypothetical protein